MPNRRNAHMYRLNLLKRCGPMISARMSMGWNRLHFTRSGLQKHFTKQAADAVESHANLGISGSRLGSSLPLPTGRSSASSCAAPGLGSVRAEMRNGDITCVRHASSISICPWGRNLPAASFVPLYLQACHGRPCTPAVYKQTTRSSTHSSAQ